VPKKFLQQIINKMPFNACNEYLKRFIKSRILGITFICNLKAD
jgi:hypothetical protein